MTSDHLSVPATCYNGRDRHDVTSDTSGMTNKDQTLWPEIRLEPTDSPPKQRIKQPAAVCCGFDEICNLNFRWSLCDHNRQDTHRVKRLQRTLRGPRTSALEIRTAHPMTQIVWRAIRSGSIFASFVRVLPILKKASQVRFYMNRK